MSRPLRLEYPGALFHVFGRGNERRNIFRDDRDRRRFLELFGETVERFAWIVSTYALMPNHFHFLIQLKIETLSKGMHWFNGQYARAFNWRHDRVGHLYQGRYHSKPVQKESYSLEVIRYIILNPVMAGIVARAEDYRWSSYRAVLGLSLAPKWLAVDDALVQFGPDRELARAAFRSFVDAGIGIDDTSWKNVLAKPYLGSEEWIAEVRERIKLKPRSSEHPCEQRIIGEPSMIAIVSAVAKTFGTDEARIRSGLEETPRMVAAWIGWNGALLKGREVAADLRLSCGRVSQLVRLCDRELARDGQLRDAVSTISRKLKITDLTPTTTSS